jgi:DNA-binding beta-propeller fold protein YncE
VYGVRAMVGPRYVIGLVGLGLGLGAGCGSSPSVPSVPEPAASPAPRATPAGRVVRLPGAPEGIVADPKTGLVAVGLRGRTLSSRRDDVVALLDGRTGRIKRRVHVSAAPRHLQLAGPGGPVLAPTEDGNALQQISLPGGRVTTTRVGREPHDATAAVGRLFVGDELADTVSVIEKGKELRRIPAPVQPGGLAGTARGAVGVVGVRGRQFEVFDGRSLRPVGRIGAGVGPTHVVAEPEGCFYIADTQGDAVLLVHLSPKLEQYRRINVPGTPYGIAIDPNRDRLWVTQTRLNQMVEYAVNGRRPKLLQTLPTVRQPNTVAVNSTSGRVYVTGRADQLQILDPPKGEARRAVPDDAAMRCR